MINLELDQADEVEFNEEDKLLGPMSVITKPPLSNLSVIWLLCFDTMREYYKEGNAVISQRIYTYDCVHAVRINGKIIELGGEVRVDQLFAEYGYDINKLR